MKTEYIPIDEEQIPPGELAVYRGARVEAADGKVGVLGEFLVNPLTGHISHLILMEGHLWGKREVTIPVSAIDRIEEDTVYFKLDKKAVESLPSEPVRRHWQFKTENVMRDRSMAWHIPNISHKGKSFKRR